MSSSSSLTWAAHVRILFQLYKLPDPLLLLDSPPWPKQRWKDHTKAAVISHHEASLRREAASNSKLPFLNVQAVGLAGRLHPVLAWVLTTQDVTIIRPHIKMLAGDYLTYANLAHDRGIDPHCRMCHLHSDHPAPTEDLVHLVVLCRATSDTRDRILPEILNTLATHNPTNRLLSGTSHMVLTQFILDCSSLNLPADTRIPQNNPSFTTITKLCSNLICALHKERTRQLKAQGLLK